MYFARDEQTVHDVAEPPHLSWRRYSLVGLERWMRRKARSRKKESWLSDLLDFG